MECGDASEPTSAAAVVAYVFSGIFASLIAGDALLSFFALRGCVLAGEVRDQPPSESLGLSAVTTASASAVYRFRL